MHPITRKLFLFLIVLLAGCRTATKVEAFPESKGTVSLSYMARLYTMRMSTSAKRTRLANKYNTIEFEHHSRRVWINGTMLWLHYPSCGSGRGMSIRAIDFKKVIDPILRAYAYVPKHLPKVVVLDPGHGGKDTGAIGPHKIYEKTVVLDIAKRVRKLLEAKGIHVRMTRTSDTYPSLEQRSEYAKKVGAGLFVSIHANSASDASVNGVESYVSTIAGAESSNSFGRGGADTSPRKNNRYDAANSVLGFSLQSNAVKASGRADRGLRRARFAVLKNAPCPAALVECGFVTNQNEESLLNSASYREHIAQGIANGIFGYFTLIRHASK